MNILIRLFSTHNIGNYSGQEQALLMLVGALLWNHFSLTSGLKSRTWLTMAKG